MKIRKENLTIDVEQGAIGLENVLLEHISDDAIAIHIDCVQRRPTQDATLDSGTLEVWLGVDEETLRVSAEPDEEGDFAPTVVRISGFPKGEWFTFLEWGKYGPNVAAIRRGHGEHFWP